MKGDADYFSGVVVKFFVLAVFCLLSGFLAAEQLAASEPAGEAVAAGAGEAGEAPKLANEGSILTRKDARTITLRIPAPRGQIVDRYGKPLVQNEVAYQVALQYEPFQDVDRDYVVNWARLRMEKLEGLVDIIYRKTDDELYDHYRNRRWLPLYVSSQLNEKEAKALESNLVSGLILHPVYRRVYPEGGLAAHILGYAGSMGKLPTGPINFNEPLWEETEGRAGLEKIFNKQLTGEDGVKRLLFDENGNKLLEEQVKRPRPGGTLVTTLNLDWQKRAERVLRNGCERGALVVVDVITGEVLVMASRPTFDLNDFIPGISTEDFKALQDNPSNPLFGRAFQSAYPPASAYKPVVALAALNAGVVSEYTKIHSPASVKIGNHTFRNWSKSSEGDIDVKRALARSCNTWFYKVGIDTGPSVFLGLSRKLGMGSKTGLPLIGETSGLVPTNEWMLKNEKRRILDGDTANMSIGQGSLLASPLQVAQLMAGIGNGNTLPRLSLISQVQDTRGRVVNAMVPERRGWLGVDAKSVKVVRNGMKDVVSKGYGTGKGGSLSYTQIAAKTGTAQWGPARLNQRLAWYAGFLPYDNPRYAFAAVYEGRPGESVSGGKKAAPMVRDFFQPLKGDIRGVIAAPKKALVVVPEGAEADAGNDDVLRAVPLSELDLINPTEPTEVIEDDVQRALPVGDLDLEDNAEGAVPVEDDIRKALPVGEGRLIE